MTKIRKSPFGVFEGQEVDKYTMTEGDISVSVLTYGGILQSIVIPDKNGVKRDVLLGYDDLDGYLNNGGYLGALIGRSTALRMNYTVTIAEIICTAEKSASTRKSGRRKR